MTPIISPWIFYLIDMLGNLRGFCTIFMFALAFAIVAYLVSIFVEEDENNAEKKKGDLKLLKRLFIGLIICVVSFITIPSESTMYKMLVAQNVTSDNLNAATDIIKNGVDYIFDKLDGDKTTK